MAIMGGRLLPDSVAAFLRTEWPVCAGLGGRIHRNTHLNHLRADGLQIQPDDVARLSPLQHRHINVLGRYSFALADPITKGQLRPLHFDEGGNWALE